MISNTGKTVFLRHKIKNGVITVSEVGFIYENNGKFGSIAKYLNYKEFKDIKITNEIKQEIWDTEEELSRVKQFKRIFPSINYPLYQKFFDKERCINYILYIIEAYKHGILK